jgi:RimJ/RimL family protein N-acetyltransferase
MYEGALVRLREMRLEDAETFVRWLNNPDTADRLAGGAMPMTIEQEREWIAANAGQRIDHCNFAVETLEGVLIGSCSYHALDWKNRRCLVGWFLGEAAMRGKGYGTDMIETLLRVCFNVLGLRKVRLEVYGFNLEAIRLYERLGFTLEGTFRGERFIRGKWWDELRYGMFRSEWAARRGILLGKDGNV